MVIKFLNADYYHTKVKSKLVIDFLKSIRVDESILDMGAGEMPFKKYCEHLNYTSQDFCQYEGKGDGRGLQTDKFDVKGIDIVCDIKQIPVPDERYDNILCSEVLEHIENPLEGIKEMKRILKPGGKVIITVPGTSLLHFSPYHYYTGFKDNFFNLLLGKSGFDIDRITRVGTIYSVTALYLWYIADKFSKVIFPWRSSLFFKMFILGFSPFISLFLILDYIRILDTRTIEAGLLVIATKRHENSHGT
ncbi:MAG: class I SAM-dependent methyltransferase [Candidatus Jettenia sp.]|nr:class I SAM-dependent methyltransferase [Candidatus Jettenia sp.]